MEVMLASYEEMSDCFDAKDSGPIPVIDDLSPEIMQEVAQYVSAPDSTRYQIKNVAHGFMLLAAAEYFEMRNLWKTAKAYVDRNVSVQQLEQLAISELMQSPLLVRIINDYVSERIQQNRMQGDCRLSIFRGHKCEVTSICDTRDGLWLIVGTADGAMRVWDRSSGNWEHAFTVASGGGVFSN